VSGPAPAVAQVRSAVRAVLEDLTPNSLVLAAVSGGRDSLALADALAFEASRAKVHAGALIVDHQLQQGSGDIAAEVAATLRRIGLNPVEVLAVTVGTDGGPEAAARDARYDALTQAGARLGASAILLGHTRDDQAESVLLGLARGSGARSLSGMAAHRDVFVRPLLGLDRETTGAACLAADLTPWDDPHNDDPAYARSRVRAYVMPVLEKELGPGVAAALARTAALLRDDDAALRAWADRLLADAAVANSAELDCAVLAAAPAAVRRRTLREAAIASGASAGALRESQLRALDALIASWHGQGSVDLPGGVRASRTCGRLGFDRPRGSSTRSAAETQE
jgi:tRNA(Ile)-lysidine synthase